VQIFSHNFHIWQAVPVPTVYGHEMGHPQQWIKSFLLNLLIDLRDFFYTYLLYPSWYLCGHSFKPSKTVWNSQWADIMSKVVQNQIYTSLALPLDDYLHWGDLSNMKGSTILHFRAFPSHLLGTRCSRASPIEVDLFLWSIKKMGLLQLSCPL